MNPPHLRIGIWGKSSTHIFWPACVRSCAGHGGVCRWSAAAELNFPLLVILQHLGRSSEFNMFIYFDQLLPVNITPWGSVFRSGPSERLAERLPTTRPRRPRRWLFRGSIGRVCSRKDGMASKRKFALGTKQSLCVVLELNRLGHKSKLS